MFLRSSSRPQPVDCFFCLSPSLLPPHDPKGKGKGRMGEVGTKWNWNCERCGCWNIRDERGEMISELPAMSTPVMNKRSSELRAKPSSSHLPSTTVASPFCHICLTNQTLIMNMLANYLPAEDDPTYPSLYADLPNYLSGVHARYPPVCSNCQPAVDDALRKANHRANVDAWGSALRRGNEVAGPSQSRVAEMSDVLLWRIRGVCFCLGAGVSLGTGVCSIVRPDILCGLMDKRMLRLNCSTALVAWNLLSVVWTAWDPYWLRRRRSRSRARVTGRKKWLLDMATIYLLRLSVAGWIWYSLKSDTSAISPTLLHCLRAAFVVEVTLFLHALTSLQISAPVATRPIQPVTLSRAPSPTRYETSRKSTPLPAASRPDSTNPIFGRPAFATDTNDHETSYEPMDWEPSPTIDRFPRRPPGLDEDDYETRGSDWDSFAVNKQRMFSARDGVDETGLESLIAGWGIDTTAGNTGTTSHSPKTRLRTLQSDQNGLAPLPNPSLYAGPVGELVVRSTSCLLAFARIVSLILLLSSTIDHFTASTLDKVLSGVEIGTIVMSGILLPKTYPSPRVAILGGDMILHLVYVVFQRQQGPLGEVIKDPWMAGMTWGQWALLDATRVLL